MAFGDRQPRHAPGRHHGDDFIDVNDVSGLRIGVITQVDEINMTASVMIVTGGQTLREEVKLTQGMAGPRSFWGGVPELNSVVVLGYLPKHRKNKDVMILGYLPSAVVGSSLAMGSNRRPPTVALGK